MVKVTVDGKESVFNVSDFENFGKLYDELSPKGKVLKHLIINNVEIPAQKVSELRNSTLEEDTNIIMEFVTPSEYLVEILPGVIDYVKTAVKLLPNVAESLRYGQTKSFKDIESLSDSISALDSLRQSIRKITVGPEPDTTDVLSRLRNFLKCLEKQDKEDIANAVENDLPIVLKFYQEFFQKTLEKLREEGT